jgi:hypothetical protein
MPAAATKPAHTVYLTSETDPINGLSQFQAAVSVSLNSAIDAVIKHYPAVAYGPALGAILKRIIDRATTPMSDGAIDLQDVADAQAILTKAGLR